jgi:hypothetical protein
MNWKPTPLLAVWMIPALCLMFAGQQAAAQRYVPGEGYVAEEEWYDVGDWFDGNNWEYEDDYDEDLYSDRNDLAGDEYEDDFDAPDYAEDATYGDLYNDDDGFYADNADAYYDNYYTSDWYDESAFGDWYDDF